MSDLSQETELAPDGGLRSTALVREIRWMLLHLVFLIFGFALIVWGGWSMIFDGNHTTLAQFQGGYVMYAIVKIDGWLKRKSGLPNAKGDAPT